MYERPFVERMSVMKPRLWSFPLNAFISSLRMKI